MGSTSELPLLEELSYELPQVVDSTIITSGRSCMKKCFNAHMQHLRGDGEHIALLAGGTFAAGLEAFRWHAFTNFHQPDYAFDFALQAMIIRWGDYVLTDPKDTRQFDKIAWALREYFKKWPTLSDPIRPHLSGPREDPTFEFSFAVELEPSKGFPLHPTTYEPFIYAGRFDLMGMYNDILPVIEDDKTTRILGPSWMDQWVMRHQFLGYIWALKQLGYPHRHVVVRGIGLKKELELIETQPIHVPNHMLDKFEDSLRSTLHRMVQVVTDARDKGGMPDPEFGEACIQYFKPCVYTPLCLSTPQNELRFMRTMNREKWDPLGTERIVDQVKRFPYEVHHKKPLESITLEDA
jgi:hypothetical protein